MEGKSCRGCHFKEECKIYAKAEEGVIYLISLNPKGMRSELSGFNWRENIANACTYWIEEGSIGDGLSKKITESIERAKK